MAITYSSENTVNKTAEQQCIAAVKPIERIQFPPETTSKLFAKTPVVLFRKHTCICMRESVYNKAALVVVDRIQWQTIVVESVATRWRRFELLKTRELLFFVSIPTSTYTHCWTSSEQQASHEMHTKKSIRSFPHTYGQRREKRKRTPR